VHFGLGESNAIAVSLRTQPSVFDSQDAEKYISRSADGKDPDRMTFLPE
jgi:hypothetical protein